MQKFLCTQLPQLNYEPPNWGFRVAGSPAPKVSSIKLKHLICLAVTSPAQLDDPPQFLP
jgi:hypothetical protein